jgi:hypothetical protein
MCEPGGIVLDLTCAPIPAAIELDGRRLGQLDQDEFLARAAQTEEAVELLIREELLVEEASLAHDVLKHYDSGPEVIEDIAERPYSRMPPALASRLAVIARPLVERVPCLWRRLRVLPG